MRPFRNPEVIVGSVRLRLRDGTSPLEALFDKTSWKDC